MRSSNCNRTNPAVTAHQLPPACCMLQVPASEGEARAKAQGLVFFETSAKLLFRRLATVLPGDAGRGGGGAAGGGAKREVVQLSVDRPAEAPPAGGCGC
ncbi:hypothetical protein T492DRAFT_914967 [Pavlovales sp. CCMP2436]|nr:hypothetical protein T492DRAFT_914967 [Pavlovales sp. CCMP2436]